MIKRILKRLSGCLDHNALREFKERLQYWVDNLFARGGIAQFGLLIVMAMLLVMFGMSAALVGLFGSENADVDTIGRKFGGGFWDTLWWSAKHIFDPSLVIEAYGTTWPVLFISIIMAIAGMVVFGTLISFISGMVDTRFEQLKSGSSIVKEEGHILILGWNSKIVPMIQLLADARDNFKVVVFAPLAVEAMREILRAGGVYERKIKVILRRGSPDNISELKRVAFDKAFSIVCLAPDSEDGKAAQNDIDVIKTLMLFNSFKDWAGPRPKMAAEILHKQNTYVANVAGGRRVPIVSSSAIVSRLLVQSSRQHGIAKVYSEVFGFTGSQIYIKPFPQCVGLTFGEIACAFPDALPLGVSRAKKDNGNLSFIPTLNPGKDYRIAEGEWLIMMSKSSEIVCDLSLKMPGLDMRIAGGQSRAPLENVLIIGWNGSIYGILSEFDDYLREGTTIDVIANYSQDEAAGQLREFHPQPFRNIKVNYSKANVLSPAVVNSLNVLDRDCVITLADESFGDIDHDGRTIMTLLLLREACGGEGGQKKGPQLVCEILMAKNREAVAGAQANEVIISPEIVAMVLIQISLQQMLASIYDELLATGGMEIYIKPATRYVTLDARVAFSEVIARAYEHREIAIGVRINGEHTDAALDFGVHMNPEKIATWQFREGDCVIVLAESLYDVEA